jgi:uncharacterized protein (TIGR00369 family)
LIAFLADAAVTFAAGSVGGERVRTVDLTINYLRVARGQELVARADGLHGGSRLIVARCDLFDRRPGFDSSWAFRGQFGRGFLDVEPNRFG